MKAVIFVAWVMIVHFLKKNGGFDSAYEAIFFGIISMAMLYYVFG